MSPARLPDWARKPRRWSEGLHGMKMMLRETKLHTVCEEARCPNMEECFTLGTATFMILGDVCTRRCGFCSVTTGKPTAMDPREPFQDRGEGEHVHDREHGWDISPEPREAAGSETELRRHTL